ncbi:Adenylosuccinate synthetase [Halogranum amylolyticum]|uniref:Adenylosuccinate synthetase n=1 Tax=Halogranum amylolyticum TaxID=660520 RepID=A0A1H8U3L6_9EURY|nr:adenylosuccinate synthase [Halogranum amylolyticum]SEO97677.1 Adenylosuccinate synthetase [Halogranum amylolyticum]
MTVTIVGSQLGDEGKGALVDLWGGDADIVVRYQGGDNAGHTVVEGGEEYKLSLVPSGAVRDKVGILGNGCVVNPRTLFDELDQLRERGLDPDVRVARRAHIIMPYHRVLDGIEEEAKSDSSLDAGTTGRGIGPTYEDKAGRRGIRAGDLLDPEVLRERLEYVVPQKKALAEQVFGIETGEEFDVDALYEEYKEIGERFQSEDMTVNAGDYLGERLDDGANLMFEGAQGTSIDIDHGIYPYVTSSNPTAGGASTGSGVGPTVVGQGEVVGIVKAYLSRVGTGPLPTELTGDDEDLADYIREKGGEFGTVTGRPRRIGWLDMPMLRHAARVNGFTGIAVNHLDVLAGLDEIKVGHAYDLDGEELKTMPATTERWGDCEPVLKEFDTWPEVDWTEVADDGYDAIPAAARDYLDYVSDEVGAPVYAVGVGPDRAETVELTNPFDN